MNTLSKADKLFLLYLTIEICDTINSNEEGMNNNSPRENFEIAKHFLEEFNKFIEEQGK